MERIIYMDHAATTYIKKEVLEEMNPYFINYYGNPSSQYSISIQNKMAIEFAKEKISKAINCNVDEIYITSGATEADNWAIKGFAFANKDKGNHIITSKIEHEAVLNTCRYLENIGFEITYLPVDKEGFIKIEDLKNAIKDTTILVSIMYANNEIGTIEPVEKIGKICKERNIVFHTDAVQAFCKIPIDVKNMNIQMMSLSAHKIYGPKGIGALYIKKGIKIHNLIHGGAQERGKRSGTENVPLTVGFGKAVELGIKSMEKESKRLSALRDKLIDKLIKIDGSVINGPLGDKRLPNNINVSFKGISGEDLVFMLDREGICASSGSACQASSIEPSHVLTALGLDCNLAKSSIRLTLGEITNEEHIDYVEKIIKKIVIDIREKNKFIEENMR
ncbi:cysteine desulfurase [Clostridium tetanomorphum]|uniref:Cysteine desulfurase IscS n=1 Tax=Clostridium tetanomorphum TaxID=1553 RepID=A0A923EEH0_CLOTT|nr:cysteine desulfurase NifS [Clostridium tetanomorphum]KAJ51850.1 cysteine desulfurase NifS [Clostridium tetanomorphum DSM 665]MBC2399500.1 cysteine desulfurase NifS [Clostridium tetanomorphum]MBP1864147.1 cysteine desulfurase [Clostridium tetanomorphum]NRS84560.1 cysteine desulfurase [Clostridium tetanomorphum]NRZ97774.1 cysteine desulfurase [Clostridium tetanomorphum]